MRSPAALAGTAPPKARLADVLMLAGDPELSDAEVRLWAWYRRHHIDERGAWVTDEVTSHALSWSPRKLQAVRARLVAHGLLRIVPRGPGAPVRYPLPHPGRSHQIAASQESHRSATHEPRESHPDASQASQSGVTQPPLGSHLGSHDDSQPDATHLIGIESQGNRGNQKTRAAATEPSSPWSAQAIDTWRACGGEPDAGPLLQALKPIHNQLERENPATATARLCLGLTRWLRAGKAGYGPHVFKRDWRRWIPGGEAGLPSATDLSLAEFVAEEGGERRA